MRPRILCVYYSQSGQLRSILDSLTAGLDADVHFAPLTPVRPFPFPWQKQSFMDAMPESVARTGTPVQPLEEGVLGASWDLVILGYGPWFLHPPQPVSGFLRSNQAATLLKGKKVLTLIGCRNMWLHAQECIKEDLQRLSAELVGNLVLEDRHSNYTSLLTIVRWMFTGQKGATQKLPEAGVSSEDIQNAARFAPDLTAALKSGFPDLQDMLVQKGAVPFHPNLLFLEQRGVKGFRKFAARAIAKGGPGSADRQGVISAFGRLLTFSVFALNPIANTLAKAQGALMKRRLHREAEYFASTRYEKGRF
jgi:hypothetical protein